MNRMVVPMDRERLMFVQARLTHCHCQRVLPRAGPRNLSNRNLEQPRSLKILRGPGHWARLRRPIPMSIHRRQEPRVLELEPLEPLRVS